MESSSQADRPSPVALHKQLTRIWGTGPGWRSLAAVNHNILGRRFMVAALVFFAIGGGLAMLIRAQLATSHSGFAEAETYNQIFTMHGTVMMFLFAIPMIEGFAVYMLPKLLGARDLAFPRLTAYGFWCFVFGGTMLIVALLLGLAPDSGWFMYTPLSSKPFTPGINADFWLLGVTFVEISALVAAVEILVTILKLRAPGMSLNRMPIFGWYMLVTAGMMLIGFPPLILGSILLEMERAFDLPYFDPTRGGDPLLWQHLFWLFGHPEVYIIFLPGAGVLSTMIPVFAQRPLVGYRIIVVAIVALGFLSFGLWVHHMFTVGIPHLSLAFFSAASALVAIPTAVQIFAWIATLANGRPRFDVPMLYIFGFFVIFVIGGMTGVMLAMVPFNWQAHDTHFVVAHMHYVLVGGFVFPMLAALYYWLPHFLGRLPVYRLSVPAFWLTFIGFNLTFLPMHLTGLLGMPRRVFTYPSSFGWDWLNLTSSIGGFITAAGFSLVLLDLVLQARFGRRFRRDPWQAGTLEWAMPTPPPLYNFASIPAVERRADGLEPARLGPQAAGGAGYLGFTREERQETLGVSVASGQVDQVVVLPRRTFLPLWSGLATAAVFVSMLLQLYLLALLAAGAVVALFLLWTRGVGLRFDCGPVDIGRGEAAPLDAEAPGAPSWWGVVFALAADATLFASLLFGALFLAVVGPVWPPEATLEGGWPLVGATGVLLVAAAVIRRRTLRAANQTLWLAAAGLCHLGALAAFAGLMVLLPDPTEHAYGAIGLALFLHGAIHAGLGALLAVYCIWRLHAGYISPARNLDLRIGQMWNDFTAIAGLVGLGLFLALPLISGSAT